MHRAAYSLGRCPTATERSPTYARVQSCICMSSGYSTPSGTIQVPNPSHGRTSSSHPSANQGRAPSSHPAPNQGLAPSSHPQPNEPFLKARESSQPLRSKSPVASFRPPIVPAANLTVDAPYAVAPNRARVRRHSRALASSLDATLFARPCSMLAFANPSLPEPVLLRVNQFSDLLKRMHATPTVVCAHVCVTAASGKAKFPIFFRPAATKHIGRV